MRRGQAGVALAVLLALLVSAPPASAPAAQAGRAQQGPRLEAKAWALIDARSGETIASHGAARHLLIASTTKLMTAWVALRDAVDGLLASGAVARDPLRGSVAAVSVGLVGEGQALLDLDYGEDSTCETDMNVVMTEAQGMVEVQGTAEGRPFTRQQADRLLDLAALGIGQLAALQRKAFG